MHALSMVCGQHAVEGHSSCQRHARHRPARRQTKCHATACYPRIILKVDPARRGRPHVGRQVTGASRAFAPARPARTSACHFMTLSDQRCTGVVLCGVIVASQCCLCPGAGGVNTLNCPGVSESVAPQLDHWTRQCLLVGTSTVLALLPSSRNKQEELDFTSKVQVTLTCLLAGKKQ